MLPAEPHLGFSRRNSAAARAVVATLVLGCGVAGSVRSNGAAPPDDSGKPVAGAAARPKRPTCDGCEHELAIHWEASLAAAFERGRREKKPVLVAFSARRQDHDFTGEF